MQSLFELLGFPPHFSLDSKELEKAYFEAQRRWHPDRFVGKPEAERAIAIERSQQVNDAYETLKNPLRRAEHLLELQGIVALGEEAVASPDVLMEMMDLREQIADASSSGAELAVLVSDIKAQAVELQEALAQLFADGAYERAAHETVRFHYLGKAMEEAHMYIYRLKAAHG